MRLLRLRCLISACFCSTGAALLVYIVSGLSLLAGLAIMLGIAGLTIALIWNRSTAADRSNLCRLAHAGAISGLLTTGAYDLSRYVVIKSAGFAYWPFDVFTIFGQALVGAGYQGTWITITGLTYHLANGVGFAIAYTALFGSKGPLAGIAWAMALELLMISIYPGWLEVNPIDEFIQLSALGHLAYGTVLGFTARHLLKNGVRRVIDTKWLTDALVGLWWVRLPLAARRLSAQLALTLVDGFYLVAWPRIAAILTPLLLLRVC